MNIASPIFETRAKQQFLIYLRHRRRRRRRHPWFIDCKWAVTRWQWLLGHMRAFNHHCSFNWFGGTHHFKWKQKHKHLFHHGIFTKHNTFHILGTAAAMELKITHLLIFMTHETTARQPSMQVRKSWILNARFLLVKDSYWSGEMVSNV